MSCSSCWIFWLEQIFFEIFFKKIFVPCWGGVKKLFFYTWWKWVTNLLYVSITPYNQICAKRNRKKRPGGVNFFHFLRLQNPYVQNLGFGTGVDTALLILYTVPHLCLLIYWHELSSIHSLLRENILPLKIQFNHPMQNLTSIDYKTAELWQLVPNRY